MKKAFTLIEVLISIVLFTIVILFLYKTLDLTKDTNKFYSKHLDKVIEKNQIKKILIEDILESETITISTDNNENAILKLSKTTNIYHNKFNSYVTYLVTRENNLYRVESKTAFDEKKIGDSFFDDVYLDILLTKIEKFKVTTSSENKKIYAILLQQEKQDSVLFSALKIDK